MNRLTRLKQSIHPSDSINSLECPKFVLWGGKLEKHGASMQHYSEIIANFPSKLLHF